MLEYQKRYKALNTAQKQAVDHIEGPLMVIAGPGTGKTELLSMRTANILRSTDMNPSNILCLTYTESGVRAMRERLIGLIGQDAYKVAIQTFHGFGSEVISNNPDYFYSGANFRPADELSAYQILQGIFDKLSHDNPLAKKLDSEYTYMKKVQTSISDFKRAGLTPDEIQRVAQHSMDFIDFIEPIIQDFWPQRIDKSLLAKMPQLVKKSRGFEEETTGVPNIPPLSQIFIAQLEEAVATAQETGKTNALTTFKATWLEKDSDNNFVLRNKKRFQLLSAASSVYQDYLTAMLEAKLYDYDDMILRVVHGLEVFHDLRLNLQEKYQYIMVDEFQDTNGAQIRILHSLTQNPTGDAPNIMVVGDDDQAIYSFQGAQVSNILEFEQALHTPTLVSLKENYRSVDTVLDVSRNVIQQGTDRLENTVDSLDKSLRAQSKGTSSNVVFTEYTSQASEFLSVAKRIQESIKKGTSPSDTVVLARNKRDILAFLPYLHQQKIKVSYEYDDNILQDQAVELLLQLSQTVTHLSKGDIHKANVLLPTLLTHPAFAISEETIWQLSLNAHKTRTSWFEVMQDSSTELKEIALWLVHLSTISSHTSLEHMIDILSGVQTSGDFTSPLKAYFFADQKLADEPDAYIRHLEALSSIRSAMHDYKPETELSLQDFVEYVQLARDAGITLKNHYAPEKLHDAVQVMTAHKSKGLEFEAVYIINASDETWGSKSRGYSSRLSYPENIAIGQAGDSYDDKLRLFYVAMTRAKKHLSISSSQQTLAGRPQLKAQFVIDNNWHESSQTDDLGGTLIAAQHTWQSDTPSQDIKLPELLKKYLKHYRLSATHLNAFIDITNGGPHGFLVNNLLHFPHAIPPSAAMGSSTHKALQKAHQHLRTTGEKRPIEDVVGDFEQYLKQHRLDEIDFTRQLEKGSDALRHYLEKSYETFSSEQVVEFDFSQQGATLDEVQLTGIVDVLEVDEKSKQITVIDYKTGHPAESWQGKTEFEKIKLHKYKQQLMFYKLLIENSRDFAGHTVDTSRLEFIEPTAKQKVARLESDFSDEEFEQFKKLVKNIWKHIVSGNFIDTSSQYKANYNGILQFEKDLIEQ